MLILSRKSKQQIVLTHQGVEIVVEVTKLNGNRVLLGLDAPPSVQIRRAELNLNLSEYRKLN